MAKVRVTEAVTIPISDTATVHYHKGFEGTALHDHVEMIVAAGKGERIEEQPQRPANAAAEPVKSAE
jgi:hypothetical protein